MLRKIGLSESDTRVYLALLKLGRANVTQLAERSGVHRTNIYSILDKLKEMGLVSSFNEDNKMKFKVSDPENLLNYLRENEEAIKKLLPDLKKIRESVKEKVSVDVFRGIKGMKSAFNDIIREKKNIIGWGLTGQLRKYMPVYAKQYLRDIRRFKIKNRYIYVEGTEFRDKLFDVKLLPKEFLTPVATQVYADKIHITIWEPDFVSITIKSKEIANNYRKHFELLWKIAKKPNKT